MGTVTFSGTPCEKPSGPPCDGPYPNYEVVVYAEDGKTIAAKATTGPDGSFTLDLKPGNYVILTQNGIRTTDLETTKVAIHRDALTRAELRVNTGIL